MLVQAKWYLMLCVQNITHKNEALHGYVSPRVGPRELYRLESRDSAENYHYGN